MANLEKEAKKKAMGRILKLAGESLGKRLKTLRPEAPPAEEKAPEGEEIADDDAKRLIELYESKQGTAPEA